jgi:hypothetical protein
MYHGRHMMRAFTLLNSQVMGMPWARAARCESAVIYRRLAVHQRTGLEMSGTTTCRLAVGGDTEAVADSHHGCKRARWYEQSPTQLGSLGRQWLPATVTCFEFCSRSHVPDATTPLAGETLDSPFQYYPLQRLETSNTTAEGCPRRQRHRRPLSRPACCSPGRGIVVCRRTTHVSPPCSV